MQAPIDRQPDNQDPVDREWDAAEEAHAETFYEDEDADQT